MDQSCLNRAVIARVLRSLSTSGMTWAWLALAAVTLAAPAFAQMPNCADVHFIGVHGSRQGPDDPTSQTSYELLETLEGFTQRAARAGKTVHYTLVAYHAPPLEDFNKWVDSNFATVVTAILENNPVQIVLSYAQDQLVPLYVQSGRQALHQVIQGVLTSCPGQKIVLVGYSFGAWVINDWIYWINGMSSKDQYLGNIKAVELYGDPLWEHWASDLGQNYLYAGLAQFGLQNILNPRPYEGNSPQAPPGLLDRWQSRCLFGDPICGEGYPMVPQGSSYSHQLRQVTDAGNCANCPHLKYTMKQYPAQLDNTFACNYTTLSGKCEPDYASPTPDYAPTTRGAYWLALKTFPPEPTTTPRIVQVETFREGVLVFFRVLFTNPNYATGFGFRGTNGSGWAEENFPFSSPSYGRVSMDASLGKVEYPFNHACATLSEYQSDVEILVNYNGGRDSQSVHLACLAPTEEATPFPASSAIAPLSSSPSPTPVPTPPQTVCVTGPGGGCGQ